MVIEGEANLDSAIEATKLIDNTLNQVKNNFQSITNQLKEKDEELQRLKTELENLNKKIGEQKQEIETKETKIETLTKDLETAKEKSSRSEEEIQKMEKENIEMKRELSGIQEQLSKISEMYRELSHKKDEAIDVRELLTIYITLLEQVFAGMPHAKVLWLLHGAKSTLNRNELTKTAGVQPAVILKSIHDLQQAKLVQYDMNSQDVKLLRKLY